MEVKSMALCPSCKSDTWFGEERFEEGMNHKYRIYWRECADCGCKFDETVTIKWEKDSYGRLKIVSQKSPPS